MTDEVRIEGTVAPGFEEVRRVFEQNFRERGEVGAAVAVVVRGITVVDLWGGSGGADDDAPWGEDSIVVSFSATKAAVALCVQLLIQTGELSWTTRVAEVWPGYTAEGKGETTVGMLLDHSAGVPVLSEPLKDGALEDWEYMVSRLERQAPFWAPGHRHGYHPITFGYLLGEVVRRVTGSTIGTFFRQEFAEPWGLDFWIGTPAEVESRVVPVVHAERTPPISPFDTAIRERGTIPYLFGFNSSDWMRSGVNTRAGHAAEIPAANGITNARSLARMYALLLDNRGPGPRFSDVEIADMVRTRTAGHVDATLLMPTRFAAGFMRGMPECHPYGPGNDLFLGEQAFGHTGSGGSVGFADPAHGTAFGYTMSRLGSGLLLNDRGQSLVDAVYRALGVEASRTNH